MKETSNATTPVFCSEAIEKNFRDARLITVPENLQNRAGRRPDISTMRMILQNWWNPEKITSTMMKSSTKNNYRYMVRRYLNGEETNLSSKQFPLIEEYREYITTEPEDYDKSTKYRTKGKRNVVSTKNNKDTKNEVVNVPENKKPSLPEEFMKYIKELGVKEFILRF